MSLLAAFVAAYRDWHAVRVTEHLAAPGTEPAGSSATGSSATGSAGSGGLQEDSELTGIRERDETRRARLWVAADLRGVPLRAILTTVAVVVLVYLAGKVVYRLREVILLLVVSGFVALLLNPLVATLERRVRRRGIAVGAVTVLAVLIFAGLAAAFGYPLVNGMTHLAADLPAYVSKAEHGKGWIGHLVVKYNIQAWVASNAPKLAGYAKDLANPVLSVGKGAITLVIQLLTIFVLVVLLLMEGPKLRGGLLGLMSPDLAIRYSAIGDQVNKSVTGYMLGNFATSVIAGIVVLVTLLSLGVPFPFLWALWVALVDFLPMIGGALAGIPVVLFATTQSLPAGLITAVVFVVYTQAENHVLNPVIMSKTVRINPLLVMVSILVGASLGSWVGGFFGGFVAALLAIPVAGALQVIVREAWRSTAPNGHEDVTAVVSVTSAETRTSTEPRAKAEAAGP
jgi:predicted PurR-regulated permease PerM